MCCRAELEYIDRPDPGLVAAGTAHRMKRPARIDVVAEPHGAPLRSMAKKRRNNKSQDVGVRRPLQLLDIGALPAGLAGLDGRNGSGGIC